ncbi:ThiF family adenylyltransferase [Tenacibaculum sp. M341]|uniref:ThiF family adenylyltransferase n=1 Tax=Tenacibaculum sp. M341 TaxID=2530339 RepID=UPI001A9FCC29|nr:ThiF family adenylyltransferase [Tenacibaculum sp. M341]
MNTINEKYVRNSIYISNEEQEVIKNYPIFIGGAGIGSLIAECSLRLGFENITIVDGDTVENSNLNRQNYIEDDINTAKVEALKNRLHAINSNAKIKIYKEFITPSNIKAMLNNDTGVAINALDFCSDIPLVFDRFCQKNNIPVLHPYNIGWGGLLTVIMPDGMNIEKIFNDSEEINELEIIEYANQHLDFWQESQPWIGDILNKYKQEKEQLSSTPQLSIGCYAVAAMCATTIFKIATNKPVKAFPEFYISNDMYS